MLNWIWLGLILLSVLFAGFTGRMEAVSQAIFDEAANAVQLVIGLVGGMMLFLGLMNVAREGGLLDVVARGLHPLLRRLFPDVPAGHPAMGAMVMNIASNMLGLGNAATPFGLKAMKELDKINKHKGTASNSMALFLAINTSGVAVMPLGVVAVRASQGCKDPARIFIPSMIATACSTIIAVIVAKTLERSRRFVVYDDPPQDEPEPTEADKDIKGLEEAEELAAHNVEVTGWRRMVLPTFFAVMGIALIRHVHAEWDHTSAFEIFRGVMAQWILPFLMALILMYGVSRKVRVYESVVNGAKEGFEIAVMIIPFLVAILVAIGCFRASGMLDVVISFARHGTDLIGMPAEALPMALIRPLSGSGALTVLMDTLNTHGKDSFVGFLVSVMNGSTETTFYVLALYYGSVQVRRTRHTVLACLSADAAGILAAVAISRLWWG